VSVARTSQAGIMTEPFSNIPQIRKYDTIDVAPRRVVTIQCPPRIGKDKNRMKTRSAP
jgi:hypothetical protein